MTKSAKIIEKTTTRVVPRLEGVRVGVSSGSTSTLSWYAATALGTATAHRLLQSSPPVPSTLTLCDGDDLGHRPHMSVHESLPHGVRETQPPSARRCDRGNPPSDTRATEPPSSPLLDTVTRESGRVFGTRILGVVAVAWRSRRESDVQPVRGACRTLDSDTALFAGGGIGGVGSNEIGDKRALQPIDRLSRKRAIRMRVYDRGVASCRRQLGGAGGLLRDFRRRSRSKTTPTPPVALPLPLLLNAPLFLPSSIRFACPSIS